MYLWPSVCLSVRPSVCPVSDPKSRMEERSELKFGRKEVHDTDDPWSYLEYERSNSCLAWGYFGAAQLICFTGTLLSNGGLLYYDLQAESSGWLFKSPLAGAGHIVAASLLNYVIGPVCGFVCVCRCVCLFVCGSVTTITRNCVHRSSPNWVCR